jgi:hypothetical protein
MSSWTDLDLNSLDELIKQAKTLIRYVGDDSSNPDGDVNHFTSKVQPRFWTFLKSIIENRDSIVENRNNIDLLQTKINSMEQQLKSLQATATSLNNLSTRQQSNLGMLLQTQRIRKEAQSAKEQALQSAQEAQSEADKAQMAAPDAISLQAILNRVEDVLQKSKEAASSANDAIVTADKVTQNVALIEESNSSATPPTQETNQQKNSSRRTRTVNTEEDQAAESEPQENIEELINVARSSADEAIKFSNEAQKIALEVKDLASKISQDYDNWSAVKSLFSIT